LAAAVVLGGWYAGYMFWDPRPPDEPPYATYFDVFAPALIVAIGLPLCVLAGLLVGRRGWLTAAGHGLLALGALAMAYLASFVFFGGGSASIQAIRASPVGRRGSLLRSWRSRAWLPASVCGPGASRRGDLRFVACRLG
jgi:hypothetical protein